MRGFTGMATSPLVAKLLQFTPLSDEEVRVLDALCSKEESQYTGC